MRGNEKVLLHGLDGGRIEQFSIPMRGNEWQTSTGVLCAAPWFSIPMRGNEIAVLDYAADHLEVFDPHEG